MLTRKQISAAGLVLVAMTWLPETALAQARDRCNDFANQLVSFDQRARKLNCQGWKGHGDYQGHYNWCEANTRAAAEKAEADWGSDFQRCQFQASGSPVAQPAKPAAGPSLRSGPYTMNASNHAASVTLNVRGGTFTGQSEWQCCPAKRTDPLINGTIQGGNVTFSRDCRGQGQPGPCQQNFIGKISGNTASGTWSGTGGKGNWTMLPR
jgi:hypothetical protein